MTPTGAPSPGEPHRCGSCGTVLPPRDRPGRPSAYCSNACRQKAFRKRHATRPEIVRESNLPHPLDGFVGRAAELATVRETLRTSRLLTIAGAGGVGKSRLAVEALRRAPGEVCRVGLRDGVPFHEAVAAGFGLAPDGELGRALVSAIGGRR